MPHFVVVFLIGSSNVLDWVNDDGLGQDERDRQSSGRTARSQFNKTGNLSRIPVGNNPLVEVAKSWES